MPTNGLFTFWGTVSGVSAGFVTLSGLGRQAGVGNEIRIETRAGDVIGEILDLSESTATACLFTNAEWVRIGDRAVLTRRASVRVSEAWLGRIINYRGEIDAAPLGSLSPPGGVERALLGTPPAVADRRGLGPRLPTGLMLTDTILPICRGQRLGLFAGSGVGKSTLVGMLARGISADRVVIALIGERSREINEFVARTLPPEVLARTVVVAASAGEPPGAKKRAAYVAMATAEHFRDQGQHVLLLFDSITRFAEAHRETALISGETPALNAFPPSTSRVISELAERAGPGAGSQGDITAVFSVLVAGSDMDEPVADMIRGILDGHIVLSRDIAERGRFPAIDALRSVSRCLPDAASAAENGLIRDYRSAIATYEAVAPMLRANLYEFGTDAQADRCVDLFPQLDGFAGLANPGQVEDAFAELQARLQASPADDSPVPGAAVSA